MIRLFWGFIELGGGAVLFIIGVAQIYLWLNDK